VIEILEGLPDNVVGVVVKGRVTRNDWVGVLVPAIGKALAWHHRLRLYYEIRTRYPGAAWDPVNYGTGQPPPWERVAIVSDVAWVRHAVTTLRLVLPSEVRVFVTSQIPAGLAWITGSGPRRRDLQPAAATAPSGIGAGPFRPPRQYLHDAH
jgi:hypothetical protein